jgi:parallel beta-helix repeat protein
MRVESSNCSSNDGDGLELDAGVASVSVLHTECSSNARSGIRHKGWDGTIKGTMRVESSRCSSNGIDGVEIDASPASVSVVHTECSSNARGGIRHKGWDGTIKGRIDMEACRLVSNGGSGLHVDGPDEDCDGRDMVVSGNGGTGIDIGPGVPLEGSVSLSAASCTSNGAGGISLRAVHGGALHRCVADGNTSDGIALDGPFFSVKDNRATNNSLSGIRVLSGSGSEVSRNYLSGNENGVHVVSAGNSLHDNSGSGNIGGLLSGNPANDIAPSSTAATATSPVGNLEF